MQAIHASVFYHSANRLNKKKACPHTFEVDGVILTAALLYSGIEENLLLSEYTKQHYSLLPAVLVKRLLSDRMVKTQVNWYVYQLLFNCSGHIWITVPCIDILSHVRF